MKSIKKIVCGLVLLAVAAGAAYYFIAYKKSDIEEFVYDRDAQAVDDLFHKGDNWYWMISTQNSAEYSIDHTLKYKTSSQYSMKRDMIMKVLKVDNKLAGFLAYYPKSKHVWQLLFLIVDQDFRRAGIAKKLLQYSVSDMVKLGALKIDIATRNNNFKAQSLYKKFGAVLTDSDDEFVHFSWYKQ